MARKREIYEHTILRREALRSLHKLKAHAGQALPQVIELLRNSANEELLVMGLEVVGSIAEEDPELAATATEVCLDLFKRETLRMDGDTYAALFALLEIAGFRRSPVSNLVLSTVTKIRKPALKATANYISGKMPKRVLLSGFQGTRLGPGVVEAVGATECLMLLMKEPGMTADADVKLYLEKLLPRYEQNLRAAISALAQFRRAVSLTGQPYGYLNQYIAVLGEACKRAALVIAQTKGIPTVTQLTERPSNLMDN